MTTARDDRLFEPGFLRKLERLALMTRHPAAGQMQGERRSKKRGQSVEFADFRPYTLGDDFRRIDWNAYARLERFFIKLFVEEEDLTVHLLVDASQSMVWGQPQKLTYALQIAGALGYVALTGLDRVTAAMLGRGTNGVPQIFPAQRGKRQALALFNFLQSTARENGSPDDRPVQANAVSHLQTYGASAAHPGPLLLVSDLMDDGWQEGLNRLAGRGFEVTLVHLLAPQEIQPELDGDFKLLDSENRAEVEITADYELLNRYRQELEDWRGEWQRFCRPRSIHYVTLDTGVPLEELLFAMLRRQGVLR